MDFGSYVSRYIFLYRIFMMIHSFSTENIYIEYLKFSDENVLTKVCIDLFPFMKRMWDITEEASNDPVAKDLIKKYINDYENFKQEEARNEDYCSTDERKEVY